MARVKFEVGMRVRVVDIDDLRQSRYYVQQMGEYAGKTGEIVIRDQSTNAARIRFDDTGHDSGWWFSFGAIHLEDVACISQDLFSDMWETI